MRDEIGVRKKIHKWDPRSRNVRKPWYTENSRLRNICASFLNFNFIKARDIQLLSSFV